MMLLAMLCGLTGTRAEEVTVGYLGDNDDSPRLPVDSYYNYSYSQQIYTSTEIGASGTITINAVTLWLARDEKIAEFTTFDIYMLEVDKEAFASYSDWETMTDANKVYSGTLTVSNRAFQDAPNQGFEAYTFELDAPFLYNGNRNLLIAFNGATSKRSGLAGKTFSVDSTPRTIRAYSDDLAFDPANPPSWGARPLSRNVIKFNFVANPTLTVSSITYQSAKLSWSGGEKYQVQYKKADAENWTTISDYSSIVTSKTLSSLLENTTYVARARSKDANGNVSGWTTLQFTTSYRYPAPHDLTITNVTPTSVTLNWTEDASAYSGYTVQIYDNENNWISTMQYVHPPYTKEGLTPETTYKAIVRQACYDAKESVTLTFECTAKETIGTSTGDYTIVLPTCAPDYYSLTQQIYTKEELGSTPATFRVIDFYSFSTLDTRNLVIYMASTDKSSFSSSSDAVRVFNSDRVFSGSVDFKNGTKSGWTSITLDIPFEYDGLSNVVIVVDDNTGTDTWTSFFDVYETMSNQALYINGSEDFDPITPKGYNYSLSNEKNVIRLLKGDYPDMPKPKVTVDKVLATTATISWTGDASRYNIRWTTDPTGTEWTGMDATTDKQYNLTGLAEATEYLVQVRAYNPTSGEAGQWATVAFTTRSASETPSEVTVFDLTYTRATVSWEGGQENYRLELSSLPHPDKSVFTQVGNDVKTTDEWAEYTFDLSAYSGEGTIAIRHYKGSGGNALCVDDVTLTNSEGTDTWDFDCSESELPAWLATDAEGFGFNPEEPWYESYVWSIDYTGKNQFAKSTTYGYPSDHWLIIPLARLGGTLKLNAKSVEVPIKSRGADKYVSSPPPALFGVYVTTSKQEIISSGINKIFAKSPFTFNNLETGVGYQLRVQGMDPETEWSQMHYFETPYYLLGDVNASGDVSPADAIMILYHYFGVQQTTFIKAAADLNSDATISPADAIEALYRYFGVGTSSPDARARTTRPKEDTGQEPE